MFKFIMVDQVNENGEIERVVKTHDKYRGKRRRQRKQRQRAQRANRRK